MKSNLKDKVIVITGGSGGLGKAVAMRLAKENAKLILLATNKTKLEAVKKDLVNSCSSCEYFVCDVSVEKQVADTFKNIINKFGNVDVLINNAGIWYEGTLEEHSPEKIKELFSVNSIGQIFTAREVLPAMKRQKSGQILNVASVAALGPEPDWQVYVASKYAVRGFTESLRKELEGSGIRVMAIYPGGMDTEIFNASGFPASGEDWMMKPENVADIVAFMLTRPDELVMDHVEIKKEL